MLFELKEGALEPVAFVDFGTEGGLEKELEDLIANALFDQLFEQDPLLPIAQERRGQAVADILALDRQGNLVIFELKRSAAAETALAQAFRYAQTVQAWRYNRLEEERRAYAQDPKLSLRDEHQLAFSLDSPLDERDFNQHQRLVIIASALDDDLADAIEYWHGRGIDVQFMPYRLYDIGRKRYLEFFAKPNDRHVNPAEVKGVVFDSNKAWNPGALADMLSNSRVSAYGDRADAIRALNSKDYVFLYHAGVGIVAAGRTRGNLKKSTHLFRGKREDEWYYNVEYTAQTPDPESPTALLTLRELENVTGQSYFLARIDKRPFLSLESSAELLEECVRRSNKR